MKAASIVQRESLESKDVVVIAPIIESCIQQEMIFPWAYWLKITENVSFDFYDFGILYLDGVFNLPPMLVNNQTNIAI